jgi:hypothetical protein
MVFAFPPGSALRLTRLLYSPNPMCYHRACSEPEALKPVAGIAAPARPSGR